MSRACPLLSLALLLAVASAAQAEVKVARVFSDHMVLQQKQANPIWGWAEKGETVTITIGDKKVTATAGDDRRWTAKLPELPAGGPHEIVVAGSSSMVKIADVLVGEVWLCSGQSNMEWNVSQAQNPQEEKAKANYPQIRMFTVAKNAAEKPQDDCTGSWEVCSPDTVLQFSAVGYFFGRKLHEDLKVPVGLIDSSWGGTICEAWMSDEALKADPEFSEILKRGATYQKNPNQASNLYDGMIHPLLPYGIKGAIWYQGESNLGRARQYRRLLGAMIKDWRNRFGHELPFGIVQIAPYRYGGNPALLGELWESQAGVVQDVPKTGIAPTTDIGDIKDIHPKNKQEVGRRLGLWAEATVYGMNDIVWQGPQFDSLTIDGGAARIKFKHADGGLVAKEGSELTFFEIGGDDGKFEPAKAKIDGETVVVDLAGKSGPVHVRFAWKDTAEPNLFNKAGLPAYPFRTDSLKLLSQDAK